MFQISLFTEFGRLCNPLVYVEGFTCLLMLFHFPFLLRNLRERRRVKFFCLGSATLVLLPHIVAVALSWQFSMIFEVGTAPGVLGALDTASWLLLPLLYLILLPPACVPPRASLRRTASFPKRGGSHPHGI